MNTDDEREALADRLARRLIDDPKQLLLAEGTGALHVALSESIRSVIEDVYADCGDSDPGVLSSNIAQRLAWDLPPVVLADASFRRSEVPEPSEDRTHEFANMAAIMGVPEPQGEPSDARGIIGRALMDEARMDTFSAWNLADEIVSALRAAGEAGR